MAAVDTSMLTTLVNMGFPEVESRHCLEAVGNSSVEDALELLGNVPRPAESKRAESCEEESDDDDMVIEDEDDEDSEVDMVEFVDDEEDKVVRKAANTLDQSQMLSERAAEIARVAGILHIGETPVNHLLRDYNWDSQRLLEDYFADPDKLLKKIGFDRPQSLARVKSMVDCGICFSEVKGTETLALGCEHIYCKDCWEGFLTVKINDGATEICCMGPKCKRPVDSLAIQKIVPEEVLSRYLRYSAQDFVDSNPNCTWCCEPACGKAVQRLPNQTDDELVCECGNHTCLKCSKEWHAPATCDEMEKWEVKSKDDSETYTWIKANTKPCPKCKKSIEKNGGCNHMTCSGCRAEFCWICLKDYRNHGSCNTFAEGEQKEARESLERYLHHYVRYCEHMKSRNLEKDLKNNALHKMEALQNTDSDSCWIDVQYISDATDVLIKCRRVLMYSYVRSFMLKKSSLKDLFEYNQGLLESATEALSRVLEGPSEELERKSVTLLANVAATRREHLLVQSADIPEQEAVMEAAKEDTTTQGVVKKKKETSSSAVINRPASKLMTQKSRGSSAGSSSSGTAAKMATSKPKISLFGKRGSAKKDGIEK